MDRYDVLILEELQNNGKISMAELGRKIGLSTSATSERVKKLEQEGVIKNYTVILDGEKTGMDITAFISVPVGNMPIQEMAEMISNMPQVQECHKVTGNTCFLVKVKTKNTKELEHLIDQINHAAPNTHTYLVLSTIKETTKIQVDN
ncbi:Lrp/AsnC family leucine-responsive transcriptional regulator [Anaerosolibacter carboniphilus]|uniref:Lrp/AsnC family leucine-responsive transcriptional regulator n=1 Tax=Anaerosolibacter carboniphilus TaxID=1417629 RepID=A0A841KT33_9FIRM|nr:Lrp/AsnC family transcriptional regulator [Anaerosolibacter carboniphilus]MBB6216756.1 Lrp/AsnC family leucine-responsive transcriptional regulator [Anaerosolibacter carboniphilus]